MWREWKAIWGNEPSSYVDTYAKTVLFCFLYYEQRLWDVKYLFQSFPARNCSMHTEACCDTRTNAFLLLCGTWVLNVLPYSCVQLFRSILMPGTECTTQRIQIFGSLIGIGSLPSGMAVWGQLFNKEQLEALCVMYSIVCELCLNFLDVSLGT